MIFSILLQFAPVFYNFASVVCGPIIMQFIHGDKTQHLLTLSPTSHLLFKHNTNKCCSMRPITSEVMLYKYEECTNNRKAKKKI